MDYSARAGNTVALLEHSGPLRSLQRRYPEGDGTCHNVIVHPPGGLVGGDTLDLHFDVAAGAHGLVTTPGATRFLVSGTPLARAPAVRHRRRDQPRRPGRGGAGAGPDGGARPGPAPTGAQRLSRGAVAAARCQPAQLGGVASPPLREPRGPSTASYTQTGTFHADQRALAGKFSPPPRLQ